MFASPGTGNANEKVVNSSRWCVTMCFVGPRQTETASTHGTISATTTTHAAVSKKPRNHHASSVTAASFAKFARTSRPDDLEDARPAPRRRSRPGAASVAVRSGSAK